MTRRRPGTRRDSRHHRPTRPWRGRHRRADRGSATIWVLATGLILLSLTTTGLLAGSVTVARHRAQAAADLAALAGAPYAASDPGWACLQVALVAEANDAAVTGCDVTGVEVRVAVTVPIPGAPPGVGPATASALAGPVDAPPTP